MSSYPIEFANKVAPPSLDVTVKMQDAPPPVIAQEEAVVASEPCPDPFITLIQRDDDFPFDGYFSTKTRRVEISLSKAPATDLTVTLTTSDASIVAFDFSATDTVDVVIAAGTRTGFTNIAALAVGGPISISATADGYVPGAVFFSIIDPVFAVRWQWYSQSAVFASSGGDSATAGTWNPVTLDYHDRAFLLFWVEGPTAALMPNLSDPFWQWSVDVDGCAVVDFSTFDTRAYAVMLKDACAPGASITVHITFNGVLDPTDSVGNTFPVVFNIS